MKRKPSKTIKDVIDEVYEDLTKTNPHKEIAGEDFEKEVYKRLQKEVDEIKKAKFV